MNPRRHNLRQKRLLHHHRLSVVSGTPFFDIKPIEEAEVNTQTRSNSALQGLKGKKLTSSSGRSNGFLPLSNDLTVKQDSTE